MTNLSFQSQNCDITLAEGLEEYRAYLQANGKKQLVDAPGSTVIRDHDATHVMFGLDTSIEQESMLDSWVFLGTKWKLKEKNDFTGKPMKTKGKLAMFLKIQ